MAAEIPEVRKFSSGATKSSDIGKPDYEGFLHPEVLLAFGAYMNKHRVQEDGSVRDSDNWQRGIPKEQLMKSLWRHFMDLWLHHRGLGSKATESELDALCATFFNVQALLLDYSRREQCHIGNYAYPELTPQKAKAIELHHELVEGLQVASDTLTDMAKKGDSIAPRNVRDLIQDTLAKARGTL